MQRRSIGLEDSKARGDGFVRSAWATVAPADHAVLRVGQRLEARIFVGQAKVAVAVPRSAIQIRNGRSVVDVPFGPLLLERSVAIDTVDEDWVAVVGLAPATRVLLHPR